MIGALRPDPSEWENLVRELEQLPGKYTVAHPSNTLRVLGLIHEDIYLITKRLREVLGD